MSQPVDTTTAVLLLAHGTPNVLGEMAEYLAKVTGGRPLPPHVVAELQHRYTQIGLGDTPGAEPPPLTRWTLEQARLLQLALQQSGHVMPVYVAMRNWHPFIPDMVHQLLAEGVTRILALCLAPQNSSTSTGLYRRALTAALEAETARNPSAPKPSLTFVEAWSEEPALIQAFAQRLIDAYPDACKKAAATLPVLFTAHSVPCRTIQSSESNPTPDPYPVEAKRTAELVFQSAARQLPTLKKWFFAFQSQGVAGGPWIGPTVEDTLAAIAAAGHPAVVLQPIGFLSDHVEILYDIDIAFAATAHTLGLQLFRTDSLNDSPLLTQALVNVVLAHLHDASQPTTDNL
ncbi:MAG: ferrochelatase [Acidobacteriaceae bacterium]